MKLTVLQWEKVQDDTPETREGNALYDKIDARTWGKKYSQECAIRLSAAEQRMVDEIIAKRTESGRFDPRRRE